MSFTCCCCDSEAEYVEVNYRHSIAKGTPVYCIDHAFDDDREECPCCDNFEIDVEIDGKIGHLLPTYTSGSLDNEGCCCEHP